MVIFKTKSTVLKIGNGIGVRFPNNESLNLKAEDKVLVEITDKGKIILTPIKEKNTDNYTEDKFNRLNRYRSI